MGNDLRFCQDSVTGKFFQGGFLTGLVEQLVVGETSVFDVEPIRVVRLKKGSYEEELKKTHYFEACL